MEQQFAEAQDQLQDETRLKLAMQSRVRQLEADLSESLDVKHETELKQKELEAVSSIFCYLSIFFVILFKFIFYFYSSLKPSVIHLMKFVKKQMKEQCNRLKKCEKKPNVI